MNRDEFDQWLDRYNDAFPDTLNWINQLQRPQKTLETWWIVLQPIEIQDANDVLARLISGLIPAITGYQIQDTPRVIASMCRRLVDDRNKKKFVAHVSERRKSYEPMIESVDGSFRRFWQAALELGEQVKRGEITMDENRRRFAILEENWRG